MKITLDMTPEEFQALLVPSEKQSEFAPEAYNAYVKMFHESMMQNIDPHNMFRPKEPRS
jgi:hypothetical protein